MQTQPQARRPYPTDVSDDAWAFVAPYLSLMTPEAPQPRHGLRGAFTALPRIAHTGAPRRYLPGDLPPRQAACRQTRRWLEAGVFEGMVHDPRELPPRRRVVERSFVWAARSRRLAKDYERLPKVVAGLHLLAFLTLMLQRLVTVAAQSP